MSGKIYSKRNEKLSAKAADAYEHGKKLKDGSAVRRLESKLQADSSDVITRCALLGHYARGKAKHSPEKWVEHMEWLMKNCADQKFMTAILKSPENLTDEDFSRLKETFLNKVKRNSKNANVVGHAALFIGGRDHDTALKLFKRARKLAPHDWRWSEILCRTYAKEASISKDAKLAEKAFKIGDKFIRKFEKIPHHPIQVGIVIHQLFNLALNLDDLERANKYAREMKQSDADSFTPSEKHYYKALIAVKDADVNKAKTQLLKAAHKGHSLGDYRVAAWLQEKGEIITVVDYIELCAKDHHDPRQKPRFAEWISQLREGKKISFPEKAVF